MLMFLPNRNFLAGASICIRYITVFELLALFLFKFPPLSLLSKKKNHSAIFIVKAFPDLFKASSENSFPGPLQKMRSLFEKVCP